MRRGYSDGEEENIHVPDTGFRVVTALASAPVQSFLAAHQVAVLATLGADGAPHAMPMWFLSEPEAVYMLSVADTAKVRHLEQDPRVSVTAEATLAGGGICAVVVDGRAEFMPDSAERRRLVERFLQKYHPRLEALWKARAMPPDRVMFRIAPARVKSWGLS